MRRSRINPALSALLRRPYVLSLSTRGSVNGTAFAVVVVGAAIGVLVVVRSVPTKKALNLASSQAGNKHYRVLQALRVGIVTGVTTAVAVGVGSGSVVTRAPVVALHTP